MVKDAEAHAEEDEKRKAVSEAKNSADSLIYSVEKSINENGDKIPEDQKKEVEVAIADLKGVLESEDADEINAKVELLNQAAMKIGEAMYGGSEDSGAAAGDPGAASAGHG